MPQEDTMWHEGCLRWILFDFYRFRFFSSPFNDQNGDIFTSQVFNLWHLKMGSLIRSALEFLYLQSAYAGRLLQPLK